LQLKQLLASRSRESQCRNCVVIPRVARQIFFSGPSHRQMNHFERARLTQGLF